MTKYLIAFILLLSVAQAQNTIITGKVTDASSNEPVMYCNVFFAGTKIGTMTDFDGNYKLQTIHPLDSLTVQALGYTIKTIKIRKGVNQKLNFQLSPSNISLEEIVIVPGENPAFRVLRGVWANKSKYNPRKITKYKYEGYAKVEIALSNISEKFKKSAVMKPFKSVLDSLQAKAGKDGKVLLPMVTSETINDYYYQKTPKYEKEYIKASKSKALLNITDIIQPFMGTSQHKYNFYNNWFNIFDKAFVSPIAITGRMFYRYYLMDSLMLDGIECYMIKFKPKRKGDLAFVGKMWITKKGYLLKEIKAEVGKRANFNFVDRFKIEQRLELIDSSAVFPVITRVVVDASRFTSNYGLLAKYNLGYQNIEIEPEFESNTFVRKQEYAYDMNEKKDTYWNKKRNELIKDSTIADLSYTVIDSLSNSKKIKRVSNTMDLLFEGYFPTKYFEFGHYMYFLGYNKDEGFRLQLGGRTTKEFSKNWILGGHVAYGFSDLTYKCDLKIERFLSKRNWTIIGFRYRYDIDRIGANADFIDSNPLLAFSLAMASQFGGTQNNAFGNDFSLWLRSDIGHGFQGKIHLRHYYFNPYKDYAFAYYDKQGEIQSNYILSDITTTIRYAKNEMYIHRNNDRIGVGGRKGAIFTLEYTAGLKGVLNSTFNYHKFSLNIKKKFNIGGIGRLDVSTTGTKVFGQVPPTLLNTLQGNESFLISYRSYNKMKFFEFVADQSIEVMAFHHFDGFILNKFPLLRALNLRTTAGLNAAIGSFSKENEAILPTTDPEGRPIQQFSRLDPNMPYVEVSVGIENIFKFFSINYFRRLTYLSDKENPNGVKFSVYISF